MSKRERPSTKEDDRLPEGESGRWVDHPTMLVMLLAEPDIDRYHLGSLKTIRYGASPISPEVLQRAIQVFGKDDMILSGGFNIYPREVEDVLYRHPAVLEAAVFGVPYDVWGEAVQASLSLKAGTEATEEEIIEHCREHLASYKKPKSVAFLISLPKSPHGKILKRELKAPFWKGK